MPRAFRVEFPPLVNELWSHKNSKHYRTITLHPQSLVTAANSRGRGLTVDKDTETGHQIEAQCFLYNYAAVAPIVEREVEIGYNQRAAVYRQTGDDGATL